MDGAPVARPLAKRRQLIESLADKTEDDEQSTPVKGQNVESIEGRELDVDTPIKDTEEFESAPVTPKNDTNVDDPEVESIAQLEDKLNDKKETSSKKSGILKALSPKKSLKEIEEEVARNTAQYDADTMNGEPISKTKRTSKEMNVASQQAKKAAVTAANITPTNVTRLIRMFVIILLGSYKGMSYCTSTVCYVLLLLTHNLCCVGYRVVQDNIASRDSAMISAMEGLNTAVRAIS